MPKRNFVTGVGAISLVILLSTPSAYALNWRAIHWLALNGMIVGSHLVIGTNADSTTDTIRALSYRSLSSSSSSSSSLKSSRKSSSSNSNSDSSCLTYRLTDCEVPYVSKMDMKTGTMTEFSFSIDACELICDDYSHCFSGDDTVEILNQDTMIIQSIPMSDLKVGDEVVVGNDSNGNPLTERVVDFFHREPGTQGSFLSIQLENVNKPLLITSKHLLKKATDREQLYDPESNEGWIYAQQIQPGDWVFFNGKAAKVEKVKTSITKRGIYAPLTQKTCTIQVNGVGCSCFAEIQSQRLGKIYCRARRYLVEPLSKEECTPTWHHKVGKIDSTMQTIAKKIFKSQTE